MSRVDDLPADQKATLQLLLKRGKGYDELAGMLRLEPHAVRERALNALDALGPETVSGLSPERQDELSDYLLGQQSAADRAATRAFLEGSASGRAWARAVAAQLGPLAGEALPAIPDESSSPPAATAGRGGAAGRGGDRDRDRDRAAEGAEQSSKVGGAILLAGAAIVAVLVVLVVSRLGGDDKEGTDTSAAATTTTAQADTSGTAATGATPANGGIESQIPMTSTTSDALASGFILKQGGERILGINGQNFPANDPKSFNYAVWLYTSPQKAFRLGFVGGGVAATGAEKGRLVTGADPAAIAKAGTTAAEKAANQATAAAIRAQLAKVYTYKELIVTREPAGKDSKTPGQIVVSGPIVKPK